MNRPVTFHGHPVSERMRGPDAQQMSRRNHTVFLFDVDNTLLDNDRVTEDLAAHVERHFGSDNRDRYFSILDELRAELGYVDYLGALQRFRVRRLDTPTLLELSFYLVDYPFRERLYSGAMEALQHAHRSGQTVILSDGDVVFQPRKVQRSGLWDAVDGHVLIYIHKEQMLADVAGRYPATRYVMVDDKLRILTAMKAVWGERLLTVFVRQGHYALDAELTATYPPADITVERIGDLIDYRWASAISTSRRNR